MVGLSEAAGSSFEALGGWPGVLGRLVAHESLDKDEAGLVLTEILGGTATPAQIGAFLVALRAKGETPEEIAGLVAATLAHAEPLPLEVDALDVVGTGGDRLASINVSTIAALVAAGAGAPVCKHGNRAASSPVGTADVLEALGVVTDLDARGVARCVRDAGMGFCFAPRYHPALRRVGPVRRELGVPTVFNILGPLCHPARVRRQLVGVSDPTVAHKMAEVLGRTGSSRAMVVYADDGLDELSVTSPSTIVEIEAHEEGFVTRTARVDPRSLGIALVDMATLRGGDAEFNAQVIRRVLDGEHGAPREIGVLNAAAALVVAGRVAGLHEGLEEARASIDSGRAAGVLEGLVRISGEMSSAAHA